MPYLDISAVHDAKDGMLTVFAVNRHGGEPLDLEFSLEGFGAARLADHQVMTSASLEDVNALANPNAVTPKAGAGAAVADDKLTARLAPHSYQMFRLKLGA